MKTIVLVVTLSLASVIACNDNKSDRKVKTQDIDSGKELSDTASILQAQQSLSGTLVQHYLLLKNALTNDNRQEAAVAAKKMVEAVANSEAATVTPGQKKVYDLLKDSITLHAKHISSEGVKIEHQREHFDMLSSDIYDLLKVFKPSQTLYLTHCPMFNNNKGANWLSEVKEVRNPYYGKEMPDCGVVKEEINP